MKLKTMISVFLLTINRKIVLCTQLEENVKEIDLRLQIQQLAAKVDQQAAQLVILTSDCATKAEMAAMMEKVPTSRDLPYVAACAFKDHWDQAGATVKYDRLISDYNNSGRSVRPC